MSITAAHVKEIRQEFAKLKLATVTLAGNRVMTVKEAIFALAPTLERMKKRGFDTQEIADRLLEKGIEIKPQTLIKYLSEFRRQKGRQRAGRQDTPPPPHPTDTVPPHTSTYHRQEAKDSTSFIFPTREEL